MEKEIKDYLHLYLKVWGIVGNSKCDYGNGEWALSAGLLHQVLCGNCTFIPHLRKLSDMSEEEILLAKGYIDKEASTFEHCHYLLSKHFDLFGLIEAGLAIDKTK